MLYPNSHFFSGATKAVYAPDPFDVGRNLQVDITTDAHTLTLTTTGPIDPGWSSFSSSCNSDKFSFSSRYVEYNIKVFN